MQWIIMQKAKVLQVNYYLNVLITLFQAMHLVYKALEKYAIPNTLPPELMPPSKRKDSVQAATLPGAVPVLPNLVMGIDGTKVRMKKLF